MKNHILDEVTIGSAKVIVDILPKGKVIPDVLMVTNFITIHNTGNIGAPAKNNHNYMKNCNKNGQRIASWHFTVDDKEIYQAAPANMRCYHAGTSRGNNTSIGIEICMFNDKERQRKCYENAIALIKILLDYYGWDKSKVIRHYDHTKKLCPAWLIEGKWGYTWSWFKNQLDISNKAESAPIFDSFLVKVIYDGKEGLNIRQEPNTSSKIMGQVYKGQIFTIVETKNGFFKLKSGAGWISGNSKYVKKI
jgi:N-acetylmuramoyl-L-alanine amidase CwlA